MSELRRLFWNKLRHIGNLFSDSIILWITVYVFLLLQDVIPAYARTPTRSPVTAGSALSPPDTVTIKHENHVLQSRLRQLQQDLQIEQGQCKLQSTRFNSSSA